MSPIEVDGRGRARHRAEYASQLQTVSKWKEQFREGIVYYLEHGKLRGVLLWNVWEKIDAARAAINSGLTFVATELDSLIPM